jgi:hypothetical protein
MNLYHGGSLDKLARPADLQKDHRYRAGLSIKALAEIGSGPRQRGGCQGNVKFVPSRFGGS